jgi:hypothetical protein
MQRPDKQAIVVGEGSQDLTTPDHESHGVQAQQSIADLSRPERKADVASPNSEPKQVTVEPGTAVRVRLTETLSTDRTRTGDSFRATLAAPLLVDGVLVAGTDAIVLGRVASAHKAPILGGKADLTLTLTDITTPNGHDLRIGTNNIEREGSRSGVLNTAKMATGAAVGAVVGALSGAAEGAGISSALKNDDRTNGFMATNRTVVLAAGTQMTFTLVSPLIVSNEPNR